MDDPSEMCICGHAKEDHTYEAVGQIAGPATACEFCADCDKFVPKPRLKESQMNFTVHPDGSIDAPSLAEALYIREKMLGLPTVPVPMLLFCPRCDVQHIDGPDGKGWTNPPHRTHLCHSCGYYWRPSDAPTVGVANIKTHGKDDMGANPQIAKQPDYNAADTPPTKENDSGHK